MQGHFIVFGLPYSLKRAREVRANNSNRFSNNPKRELLLMNDEIFLNEPIDVIATFSGGHHPCKVVMFRRASGREVKVSELGLRHPLPHGTKTIHIFDVTDGGADYRLQFDSELLTWHLTMEADHYE